jgi:hypothetical protein
MGAGNQATTRNLQTKLLYRLLVQMKIIPPKNRLRKGDILLREPQLENETEPSSKVMEYTQE